MGLCPNITACCRKRWFVLWLVLTVSTGLIAAADKHSNEKFTTESHKASPRPGRLPHLHIDQKKRFVDLDATVLQALDGQWLELLACTRRGRDHESILLVHADPSHVHLALIVLGLKPGSPMSWALTEDGVALDRLPSGPRISVSALYMVDDKQVEVPVNEWIYNQHTHKPLADNIWLFAGSKFAQIKGKEVYLADVNGSDPLVSQMHVKMSGCPNGCGQHHIADIGFHGAAAKGPGGQVPAYELFLGGSYDNGDARIGQRVKTKVPAKRMPDAPRSENTVSKPDPQTTATTQTASAARRLATAYSRCCSSMLSILTWASLPRETA